jgi:hypothetical protein
MIIEMAETRNVAGRARVGTGTNAQLLTLLALRQVEASGWPTALDTTNGIASLASLLRLPQPGVALLHSLTDSGFLEASAGLPRRYSLTEAGRSEAERLAERCWPRLNETMVTVGYRLAPAPIRSRLLRLEYAMPWIDDFVIGSPVDRSPPAQRR